MYSSRAPRSWHSSCHGTTFEWCSIAVISTTSPAPTCSRAQVKRTRLIASVALRTNTISPGRAPTSSATLRRPPSYSSSASAASTCMLRWTLAFELR